MPIPMLSTHSKPTTSSNAGAKTTAPIKNASKKCPKPTQSDSGISKSKKIVPFSNLEELLATSIIECACYYFYDSISRKSKDSDKKGYGVRGLYQVVWKFFKLNNIDRDYPSIKTHLHRTLKEKFLEPHLEKLTKSWENHSAKIPSGLTSPQDYCLESLILGFEEETHQNLENYQTEVDFDFQQDVSPLFDDELSLGGYHSSFDEFPIVTETLKTEEDTLITADFTAELSATQKSKDQESTLKRTTSIDVKSLLHELRYNPYEESASEDSESESSGNNTGSELRNPSFGSYDSQRSES
jgi:hypothetical protein